MENIKQHIHPSKNIVTSLTASFFVLYLIIGLLIYKDYGMSWDETINRVNGAVSAVEIIRKLNLSNESDSVYNSIHRLEDYRDRDYGVFFELILVAAEKVINFREISDIFYMRHLMTFLLFYASVIFFFRINNFLHRNGFIALTSCLFLVLSPGIFAHSFYNSKDIPFLSFLVIALFYSLKFIEKQDSFSLIKFSVLSGLLIDVRIIGIYLPLLTMTYVVLNNILNRKILKAFKNLFIFTGLTSLTVILFWPFLWESPIRNFIAAFSRMSSFPWPGQIYFTGKIISASKVPSWYIPVWIFISTPVIYSCGFIFGLYYIISSSIFSVKHKIISKALIYNIFFCAVFFTPLIAVIVFKSTLYDGWRHLYFIYPVFIIISIQGFLFLYQLFLNKFNFLIKYCLPLIISISIFLTIFSMINIHPFQMVYFNSIIKNYAVNNFELEYWGSGYIFGLRKILEAEKNKNKIKLFRGEMSPVASSLLMLKQNERDRFEFVDIDSAKYFITNFRETLYNEQKFLSKYQLNETAEIYNIKIYNKKILSLYSLQNRFTSDTKDSTDGISL